MLWEAVGELLPAAVVIACNPIAIVIVVVLLADERVARAASFLAGWTIGLAAVTAVVVALSTGLDADEDPTWLSVLRLVAGIVLVVAGVRGWKRRPRSADERKTPKWMAGLEAATAARAFVIGLLLVTVNPKNIALIATNATFISQVHPSLGSSIVAGAVLVVIGASSVAGCVLLAVTGGPSGQRALAAINRFMVDQSDLLLAAIVTLIGVKVIGDAITGFAQA
jgi:threonine/homoserine/homoserine lactone efflux protein